MFRNTVEYKSNAINILLIKSYLVFIEQMYLSTPFNSISNLPCFSPNYQFKKIKDYTYDTQTILGKGNFSTVHPASKDNTRQLFAIKVIKLNSLTFAKLEELLQQEINIICGLNHPNIIRCYQVLKSNNHCYFITELCEQGNLQKTLKERGPFREHEVWPYVKDIFQGLKYLSSKNIVHRDIKTANIFLKNGNAKIADFGFAIQARQSFQDMSIGSPLYMAPEGYINNRYGPKTDVWAFGVVLYELLHGFTPFHHCQNDDDLRNCQRMPLNQSQIRWDISPQLKDLILRCLTIDENERISINQIENTPYMQKNLNGILPSQRLIVSPQKRTEIKKLVRKDTGDTTTTMDREIRENPEKQNMSCKKEQHIIKKNQSQKCLKLDFYKPEANHGQISTTNRIIKADKSQKLIKGQISFNESIGLIHFCRIGFKFLQQSVSDEIICGIKALILSILEEILMRINKGMIIYDFADNKQDKEAKLKKVVKEYIEKYNQSLMKYRDIKIDFKELERKMASFLKQTEISKTGTITCCYLSLMFLVCSEYLRWSSLSKNYNIFAKNEVIDTCLDEKSFPNTYSEYMDLRKKYQSIIVF